MTRSPIELFWTAKNILCIWKSLNAESPIWFRYLHRSCGNYQAAPSQEYELLLLPESWTHLLVPGYTESLEWPTFWAARSSKAKQSSPSNRRRNKIRLEAFLARNKLAKPRSYTSLKLRLTDSLTYLLTGVKCRATSVAKKLKIKCILSWVIANNPPNHHHPPSNTRVQLMHSESSPKENSGWFCMKINSLQFCVWKLCHWDARA